MAKKEPEPIIDVEVSRFKRSPTQPREVFAPGSMDDLAKSIAADGILVPVLARPLPDGHYLDTVDGERRIRAAKMVGLKTIPTIVREMSDQKAAELQLVIALQREQLSPIEEARAYQRMMKVFGLTGDQVAATVKKGGKVGATRQYVYEKLALLKLGDLGTNALLSGRLPTSHATLVAQLPVRDQKAALVRIFAGGEAKSWRETREVVRELSAPPAAAVKAPLHPGGKRRRRAHVAPEVAAFREAARAAEPVLVFAEIARELLHAGPKAGATAIEILKLSAGDNVLRELQRAEPGDAGLVALELVLRARSGASERELATKMSHAAKRLGKG